MAFSNLSSEMLSIDQLHEDPLPEQQISCLIFFLPEIAAKLCIFSFPFFHLIHFDAIRFYDS